MEEQRTFDILKRIPFEELCDIIDTELARQPTEPGINDINLKIWNKLLLEILRKNSWTVTDFNIHAKGKRVLFL